MIDREKFRWRSAYGELKRIDEIDDDHLMNIVFHTTVRYPQQYRPELRSFLMAELLDRGLKPIKSELPHQNIKGRWCLWDVKLGKIKPISKKKAKNALVQFFRSSVRYQIGSIA